MNIAYAYEYRADDITVRSGHPYFMLGQLEKRAGVSRLFPLDRRIRAAFAPRFLLHRLRGRTYHPDREPFLLKSFATQVESRLADADVLFSPSSTATCFVDAGLPKVFSADATFANVVEAYDEYRNCAATYLRQAHAQEARALATCAAAVYPSHFAARSAIEDYGADPAKVHVLPYGANISVPSLHAVEAAIASRALDPLRVLFVGREWHRKGGDIVVAACEVARRRGQRLTLDIVGIGTVPQELPAFARSHGPLRKSDPAQSRRLEWLLAESDLLFMPSRVENYGIAFSEAAAYGIPSLSCAVGGIPTVVRAGMSGYLLPPDSPPEAYADVLSDCVSDRARYVALCRSARRFHDRELAWDRFGENLIEILNAARR
ncbi:MAG: glycosyltransferase family 4 protein [Enhydrobacter sp.]|nr:MAG: glycosyltransferase family 4 protein [Enhydrobacter sp.]